MTWLVPFARTLSAILLALGVASAASAATIVKIRNASFSDVRIAFDNGQPLTLAPGSSGQTMLDPGDHSVDCRFDGSYDGCNLANRFTLGDPKTLELTLRPTLTLEHAIALTKEGTMRAETGRDFAWATSTLEVPGTGTDCVDYSAGRLAPVSRRIKGRMAVENLSIATRTLCGEPKTVVGTAVDGAPLYLDPRYLVFRDARGRQILVTP
jgi:hypothetical protein